MSDDDSKTPPAAAGGNATLAFAVALSTALLVTLWLAFQAPAVAAGSAVVFTTEWVPRLNLDIAFRVDGLAMLFGLLIGGIGALVILYSFSYFKGHTDHARLHWLLLAFMLAMLGLVMADNILLLFVFWELTTITSFLLVGFDHKNGKARDSALQALIITGGGGLALLAGLVLLGEAAGTYLLSEIVATGGALAEHPHYGAILTLVLIGAFTKSAQFPFHFWLPNAMAAPTPVSAYLHSATMVKAGIYLMARLHPALGGTEAWFLTLTSVGAITAVWSSVMALRQTDIKLMLAWTTVMGLGTITMFLGADVKSATLAAVTFLIVHAFYKCALFLVIGNVDKRTGTRELGSLGGLLRVMPATALVSALAGFSMAGFPPFLGFIGKELKYKGALAIAEEPWIIVAASVAANAMMGTVALVIIIRVFLRGKPDTLKKDSELPLWMWLGPMLLAVGGLVGGIFPDLFAASIIEPAVIDILDRQTDVELALWHGINVPLALSVVTVLVGVLLFLQLERVRGAVGALIGRLPLTGDKGYAGSLDGLAVLSRQVTERLQNGSLSHYLTIVFVVFILAVAAALIGTGLPIGLDASTPVTLIAGVIVALIALATGVVAITTSRLLSICMLGIVGSGLAILFLVYGAIDVAITQLMVETLFVVLIAAVLPKLPRFSGNSHPGRQGAARDAGIALAAGLVVALITVGVATTPLDLSVTRYYEAASLAEAYGRNIVNVILVDFRALDTFGEIAVVAVAAMAVIALLKVRPRSAA